MPRPRAATVRAPATIVVAAALAGCYPMSPQDPAPTQSPGAGAGATPFSPAAPGGGSRGGALCFPGSAKQWNTCLSVTRPGRRHLSDYRYPSPYRGDPNYRAPVAFLDLASAPRSTPLAPNFTLGEFFRMHTGRWAVLQPHAVARLQALRDELGALRVTSAYRTPAYNHSIDGARHSRHMYGDAFDIQPIDVGLATLARACARNGAFVVEYDSHIHCDFRSTPVDSRLFGAAGRAVAHRPIPRATLHRRDNGGVWDVETEGFPDEGEPVRHWRARDADGVVIAEAVAPSFRVPADAQRVEVLVGGVVAVERGTLSRGSP